MVLVDPRVTVFTPAPSPTAMLCVPDPPRVTVPVTVHQPARRTEVHIAETMRQTKVQRGSDGEIEGSTSVTRAKVRVKDKKE